MTTFTIESLAKQPGRDMFDCGEPDLDEWLHRYARQSDARNETLTRVALHLFTPFVDHSNHLLLPVKSVRRTFGG